MDYSINFANQLAQHLKSFRKLRGLTQVQLAQHLGVTQSRVADIETNPGTVSLENLLKVLAALDIRMLLRDGAQQFAAPNNKGITLAERKANASRSTSQGDDW